MSLDVLLQAAQYIDQPLELQQSLPALSGGVGRGADSTFAAEDSRSNASFYQQQTTTRMPKSVAASDHYADFRGDISRMSGTDSHYPSSDRHSDSPTRSSDFDDDDMDDGPSYMDTGVYVMDNSQPSSSRHRRPSSKTSKVNSTSESSWKSRTDKSKRIVVTKHNTENRSVHNVLEKNRRAHLKDCFDALKQEVLDGEDEKKASHLAVLKSAVRCIQQLQKESEKLQMDADRMAKERAAGQFRLQELKREILSRSPAFDISGCLRDNQDDADSQMTCTAPGSPPPAGRYSSSPQRPLPQHHQSLTPIHDYQGSALPPLRTAPQPLSLPSLSSCLPEIHLTPPPRSRRKTTTADRVSTEQRQQRPPAAKISVEKILLESKSSPPIPTQLTTSTSLSPPNSADSSSRGPPFTRSPTHESTNESRSHLPIKLRILQDQQEGLFLTSDTRDEPTREVEEIPRHSRDLDSPSPSNAGTKQFTYQPSEIPIPAMFSQGGYWTTDGSFTQLPAFYAPQQQQNGLYSSQMYQMNQFLVPISSMGGMGGSGGMMGHLPQGLVMIPTVTGGPSMYQYGQLPSIHQLPTIPKRPPS